MLFLITYRHLSPIVIDDDAKGKIKADKNEEAESVE